MVILFLEIVGLFPTGSLVLLNTGEIAVVKEQSRFFALEKPKVEVVVDDAGQTVDGIEIDLSEDLSREIKWPLNSGPLQINPVRCFRSDAG